MNANVVFHAHGPTNNHLCLTQYHKYATNVSYQLLVKRLLQTQNHSAIKTTKLYIMSSSGTRRRHIPITRWAATRVQQRHTNGNDWHLRHMNKHDTQLPITQCSCITAGKMFLLWLRMQTSSSQHHRYATNVFQLTASSQNRLLANNQSTSNL